jgi:hypothetical protein
MPGQGRRGSWIAASVGAVLAWGVVIPALALGHLERPSYWPDPSAETVEGIEVGGEVPKARSLASALEPKGPEETHVACKGRDGERSLKLLEESIRSAENGYRLRPSQPEKELSNKKARKLERINRGLAERCEFDSVQDAVDAADNHDRVVIMPGRYREPESRKSPVNDPKCAEMTQQDSSGAETPSYRYQTECPNDQNLIYVQGRTVPEEPPPEPPLDNRMGIPDEGECLRCNLQIEGSGVVAEDVILDGGANYDGKGAEARPEKLKKHVVLRIDRADGLVAKNLLARGALEHGIYVEEVDGYRLDRTKFFWAADYGNLTFTSDHGLYKNCDGFGAGDSVVYPGAAPETGEQADKSFYPDAPRINTTVKKCDMRGSMLGYSGSMGNAVRITQNHIYGNTTGIATDTISASGHPGYPADSSEIDNNLIYANNFNQYIDDPEVEPVIGVPIGVGVLWAGHNNGQIHDNYFFDNWRRGTMLLAIPDALVTPEGQVNDGISCANPQSTTSCNNRYFDNHMGEIPPGFEPPKALDQFGVPHSLDEGDGSAPNGVDFWWDEWAGNTGNCWFENTGRDGTAASVTGDPSPLPANCNSSLGMGAPEKTAVLADCSLWERGQTGDDRPVCDWFRDPPEPGSGAARRAQREFDRLADRYARSGEAETLLDRFDELSAFGEFADRP